MSDPKHPSDASEKTLVDADGQIMQSLLEEMSDEEEECTRAMQSPFLDEEEEPAPEAPPVQAPPRQVAAPPRPAPAPAAAPTPAAAPPEEDHEEEEYGEGEATVMLDTGGGIPGLMPAKPVGRFRVVFGNDRGRMIDLLPGTHVVGRQDTCEIVLNDPAVSRRHFQVVVTDQNVKVVDLGSGNGTKLNGVRVSESGLQHGAQIEVGTSVLRFEDPSMPAGASAQPRPQAIPMAPASAPSQPMGATPRRQGGGGAKWAIFAVVFVVLGGGLFVAGEAIFGWYNVLGLAPEKAAATSDSDEQGKTEPAGDPGVQEPVKKPPEEDQDAKAARSFLKKAEQAFADRDWQEAIDKADEALDLVPSMDRAKDLRERAARERDAKKFVAAARGIKGQTLPDELRAKLEAIGKSSTYYADAQELIAAPKGPPEEDIVKALGETIKKKDVEGAEAQLDLLRKTHPGSTRLGPLEERLSQLRKALERERAAAQRNKPSGRNPSTHRTPTPRRHSKGTDLSKGYGAYKRGDYDDAIDFFSSVGARAEGAVASKANRAATAVTQVQGGLRAGEAALAKFQGMNAIGALNRAKKADRILGGHKAKLISPLLSRAYVIEAKRAFSTKRYGKAMTYVNKSLANDPGNAEAKKLYDLIQKKADKILQSATAARNAGDTPKARRLLQDVVNMAREGSPTYEKARKMLSSL